MTEPANFDDTKPVINRPQRANLEPETIRNPEASLMTRFDAVDVMWDIDDVLCPTIDEIHRRAFEAGLHDGTVEPAWDGVGQYGCEPEVYWDLWADFALEGGYVNTPPIPAAAEALRRLYWAGHRIHLVTARGFMAHASDIRAWTPQWLEDFALPWHTLTFAQDKVAAQVAVFSALNLPGLEVTTEFGVTEDGVQCAKVLCPTFDYAIDDRRKTIDALRAVGVEAYLLTHSHNRSEPSDHRVESTTEFVDIILEAHP